MELGRNSGDSEMSRSEIEHSSRIKSLKTKRHKTKEAMAKAGEEIAGLKQEFEKLRLTLLETNDQLQKMTAEPRLSEHALLRYIERFMGIDIAMIADSIMTEELKQQIQICGDGHLRS